MGTKRVDHKLPIPDLDNGSPAEKELFKPDAIGDRLIRRLMEFRAYTLSVMDETTYLGEGEGLNFVGAGVSVSANTSYPGIYDVNISGGGGSATLDTLSVLTSEALSPGALINIYSQGGSFRARKADATLGAGHEAIGWTDATVNASATATVRFLGKNTFSSGLSPGPVYLGTAGTATAVAPTTAGYLSQEVGVAESATSFAFEWHHDILIAATHAASTGGSTISQEFTTNNTFVVPAYVGAVWLTMIGGGGGGKSSTAASGAAGGGGGSGEYCQNFLIPVTGGETLTITIGAKGAGGSAGGSGADGGTTSVAGLSGTYSVLGGKGSTSSTAGIGGGPRGGAAPAGTPTTGNLGTAETPVHFGGSSGGNGGASAAAAGGPGAGSPGRLTGGAGGTNNANGGGGGGGAATVWGNGGAGGNGNAAGSSASASSYGAGGGGAGGNNAASQAGGDGAPGYVMIMYVA